MSILVRLCGEAPFSLSGVNASTPLQPQQAQQHSAGTPSNDAYRRFRPDTSEIESVFPQRGLRGDSTFQEAPKQRSRDTATSLFQSERDVHFLLTLPGNIKMTQSLPADQSSRLDTHVSTACFWQSCCYLDKMLVKTWLRGCTPSLRLIQSTIVSQI